MTTEIALVVGAGSGIGREIAKLWANEGKAVVIIGPTEANLSETKAQSTRPDIIIVIVADIAQLYDPLKEIKSKFPGNSCKINKLVYCANEPGLTGSKEQTSIEFLQKAITINAFMPIKLTNILLPILEGGRVLFLGSYFAQKGNEEARAKVEQHAYAYSVSKSMLLKNVENLRMDFARRQIEHVHVGYLLPGSVNTRYYGRFWDHAGEYGLYKAVKVNNPVIEPAIAAKFISLLMSSTISDQEFSRVEGWNIYLPEDRQRLGFTALDAINNPPEVKHATSLS